MIDWVPHVKRVCSPNANDRPENADISLLVIHNISLPPGEFGGRYVEDFFCNQLKCDEHPYFESIQMLEVSAHIFIKRNGEIIQFVPFNKRAWHAGVSMFAGRDNCNDYSIGIELEGTDDMAYEPVQYEQLIKITKIIMNAFPLITLDRIVGHSDIAPQRKTDPGLSFDWCFYRQQLTT